MSKLEKYQILEHNIGKGQFGTISKAINKETNEYVALKRIYRENISDNIPYFEEALNRELENMQKCKCNNTVEVYERIDDNKGYVIVMELCDISLSDYIDKVIKRPLSIEEIYYTFSNLNNAFKIMQEKNIVHRDLKNENIIIKYINKEKTKFIPKICDFGFSKEIEEVSKNTLVGSTFSIAPEILKGIKYDSKVDLWSIGIMIYYCCFKDYPYKGQSLINLKNNIKVPYKKCNNLLLDDLIEKLLVIDANERISWDAYFTHPFFTLSSLNEINFGFKNDNLHYYKAKYKENENEYKSVLIKAMNQKNLAPNFYRFDNGKHNIFIRNNNILNLFTIEKMKDSKNNTIIYFIYDCNENCEALMNYCKNHNFSENEITKFINDFVHIFENIDEYDKIFISIYSFVVNPNGDILLCDFGLNKYFLTEEEMEIYYAPNKEEMLKNICPSKTSLMNFGMTLLKMINNDEEKIFYENNKFVLKYKNQISEEINDIISKCLCPNINDRPDWNSLVIDEESLLNEKQFIILLDKLLIKYKTINEYYSKIDINNMKYISENEDFIILILFEINKIKSILSNKKEFTSGRYEISFLTILNKEDNNNQIESQLYNINSKNCLDIYLINDNLCPEKKNNFINEINQIYNNLIKLILKIQKITNSEKFSIINNKINDDYFENLLKQFGKSKFHNFFFSFIHKFENINKNENIDKDKACLELNICKYIGETLLFIKEGIKSSNDFKSKRYKTKEELLKDLNDIFNEDNENEKGKKYILISLFCENIRHSYDFIEHSNLEKDNESAIEKIIHFYPNILKLINFVKSKK